MYALNLFNIEGRQVASIPPTDHKNAANTYVINTLRVAMPEEGLLARVGIPQSPQAVQPQPQQQQQQQQ
jgi:hypothetical protein